MSRLYTFRQRNSAVVTDKDQGHFFKRFDNGISPAAPATRVQHSSWTCPKARRRSGLVSGGQEDDTWPPSCRTPPLPFLCRAVAPLSTHVRRNKKSSSKRRVNAAGNQGERHAIARPAERPERHWRRNRTQRRRATIGHRSLSSTVPSSYDAPYSVVDRSSSSSQPELQASKLRLSEAAGDQSRLAHPNQSSAHRFRKSDGDGARKITPPFSERLPTVHASLMLTLFLCAWRASDALVRAPSVEEERERERSRALFVASERARVRPSTHARAFS
ncbi:hypothetical protein HPB50_022267 [Hyalomma asiaticum]|uniref:Uncharacterized protein n=1 Tax=Hyalomma asiaticum TaxID=266040 RepID=A0ACB7T5Z8_HYAAI|nr:hypothetical protein HPB50_022267 [Hyalomma asiaticum]